MNSYDHSYRIGTMLLLAIIFPLICQAQLRFQLQGNLEGIDNELIYLVNHESAIVDSIQSKAGKFTFTGKIAAPFMYELRVKDKPGRIPVFLTNGTMDVTAAFSEADKRFKNTKVVGSAEHDLYRKLVESERGGFTPDEIAQVRQWQKVNDTTSIRKLREVKRVERQESFKVISGIIREHPTYYAGAFFVASARIDGGQWEIIENFYSLYSLLDDKIKNSYYGKKFQATYNKEKERHQK
jgi:hypothetical protein